MVQTVSGTVLASGDKSLEIEATKFLALMELHSTEAHNLLDRLKGYGYHQGTSSRLTLPGKKKGGSLKGS